MRKSRRCGHGRNRRLPPVQLLAYFDQASPPCGNCDNCLCPPRVRTARSTRKSVSCVYRTGQRFGAVHLIDVLLAMRRAGPKFGHDALSTFGIAATSTKGNGARVFRQLVRWAICTRT